MTLFNGLRGFCAHETAFDSSPRSHEVWQKCFSLTCTIFCEVIFFENSFMMDLAGPLPPVGVKVACDFALVESGLVKSGRAPGGSQTEV